MSKESRIRARQEIKMLREMKRFLAEYAQLCNDYQMSVDVDIVGKSIVKTNEGDFEYFSDLRADT